MWKQYQGTIVSNKEFMPGHFQLVCREPEVARAAKPGQFVHLQVGSGMSPLLRRPISIFHADQEQGEFSLVYRVVGQGTGLLAQRKPGEILDLLGPLGNGFQLPDSASEAVLVIGGGIGLAPLQYLIRQLIDLGSQVTFIAGLRNKEQMPLLDYFPAKGIELLVTTDDGSFGKKGFVTDLAEEVYSSGKFRKVYACGPEAMLERVARQAIKYDVPCQISLERTMACGVGACLGCTCEIDREGSIYYSHVCKEGPVYWGKEVLFNG